MKATVLEKPEIIVVKEVLEPSLMNEYEILVKVLKALICRHLECELWQGLQSPVRDEWKPAEYPSILGHEFTGQKGTEEIKI